MVNRANCSEPEQIKKWRRLSTPQQDEYHYNLSYRGMSWRQGNMAGIILAVGTSMHEVAPLPPYLPPPLPPVGPNFSHHKARV